MSTPSLPPRRGAHRARADLVRAVVPSVLAVAVVVALLVGLVLWRGEPAGDDSVDATGTAGVAATTSATPASRPSTTAEPIASPTPRATRPARTASADPATEQPEEPAGRDAEVVVLNQTARGGLAARVADVLRGDGWTVATTGNFRGTVPATTVYYPPGEAAAAALLAADLPGPDRTRPRISNLSQTRLTVVLTDDYEEQ